VASLLTSAIPFDESAPDDLVYLGTVEFPPFGQLCCKGEQHRFVWCDQLDSLDSRELQKGLRRGFSGANRAS